MSIYNTPRSQLAIVPHITENGVVGPANAHHRNIGEGSDTLRSYHVLLAV